MRVRRSLGSHLEVHSDAPGASISYRRPWPRWTWALYGAGVFERSLQTSDLRTARRIAVRLDAAFERELHHLRARLGNTPEELDAEARDGLLNVARVNLLGVLADLIADKGRSVVTVEDGGTGLPLDHGDDESAVERMASQLEAMQAQLNRFAELFANGRGAALADAAAATARAAAAVAAPVSKSAKPFAEARDVYLSGREITPTTRRKYALVLRELARLLPTDAAIGDVTGAVLDGWLKQWRADGRDVHSFLKQKGELVVSFVRWCQRQGWCSPLELADVAASLDRARSNVTKRSIKAGKRGRRAFTADELAKLFAPDLIDAMRHMDRRGRRSGGTALDHRIAKCAAPVLAWATGMRSNELAHLQVVGVVEREGRLGLTVAGTSDSGTKSGETRPAAVHRDLEPLVRALVGYAKRRRSAFLLPGLHIAREERRDRVFTEAWRGRVRAVLGKPAAGAPRTDFHSLRHSCAAQLRGAGVEQELIAAVLGHTDASVTAVYTGPHPLQLLGEAVDRIDLTPCRELADKVVKELLS